MLASIWAYLQDENNRAMLGWIGSGIVAVVGGLWAVFKFLKKKKSAPAPTVSASGGGVAAGRDIRGSKIDTGRGAKR